MKKFRDYLAESERTYNYRIKMVGDLPPGFVSALKGKLDQFDPLSVSAEKSTPIQAMPQDFPAHENQKVTSIDVKFRYPAIEPQIKQLAQIIGLDPNTIIMHNTISDDNMNDYRKQLEDQPDSLIADTDYPTDDAKQKEAKANYSADPFEKKDLANNDGTFANAYHSNFEIAGGSPKKAETTNDLPQGDDSPMTHAEKRPKKPATGAQPRG